MSEFLLCEDVVIIQLIKDETIGGYLQILGAVILACHNRWVLDGVKQCVLSKQYKLQGNL